MSVVTAHQTDLTTFCKFKREHKLRRALHLLLNRVSGMVATVAAEQCGERDSKLSGNGEAGHFEGNPCGKM